MKKILTYVTIFFFAHDVFSQIPTYEWAYSIGDFNTEYLNTMALDNDDNIILAGEMYGTTDMDPTGYSNFLESEGGTDAYIEKFNPSGDVLWGVNFGGTNNDGVFEIAADKEGNVYAVGYFQYISDLNPDIVLVDNVTSQGGYDMFLVKLNKEGEFVWGYGLGGPDDDWINNITIDGTGNIYVTGQFRGTVDFDGSAAGVYELSSSMYYSYDGFLAKYTPDGTLSWAFRMGGFDDDFANEVEVDNAGNIIVTGSFETTADFNGEYLVAAGGSPAGYPLEGDPFIAKYNNSGALIWAKSIVGDNAYNSGYDNSVSALALDADNNIYVTGIIYGQADFDMSIDDSSMITTISTYDSYLAKYDSDGDLAWVHTTAPKVLGFNLDLAIDENNDLYLTGYYDNNLAADDQADFDFNEDSIYSLPALGESDVYIAKYDNDAEIIWAYNIGGSKYDYATAIAIDHDFNIYAGGWFSGSDDFDANPDTNFIWLPYIDPSYGENIWFGKYNQGDLSQPVAMNEINTIQQFSIYPNPATEYIQIIHSKQIGMNEKVEIRNIEGKLIKSVPFSNIIDISDLLPGIYFIRMGNTAQKFIRQ